MKTRFLNIKQELKMDLYFATTFGFLIPIIYPIIGNFSNNFQLKFEMEIFLSSILFSLYVMANLVFFKKKRVINTISNFIGIVSYSFLAVPIFDIVKAKLDFTQVNILGVIASVGICLFLKLIKSQIDENS